MPEMQRLTEAEIAESAKLLKTFLPSQWQHIDRLADQAAEANRLAALLEEYKADVVVEAQAREDAAGLCCSEAHKWEQADGANARKMADHWQKVATILRGKAIAMKALHNERDRLAAKNDELREELRKATVQEIYDNEKLTDELDRLAALLDSYKAEAAEAALEVLAERDRLEALLEQLVICPRCGKGVQVAPLGGYHCSNCDRPWHGHEVLQVSEIVAERDRLAAELTRFIKDVPQTSSEARDRWGTVAECEPHEWDNRTSAENVLWLLDRLVAENGRLKNALTEDGMKCVVDNNDRYRLALANLETENQRLTAVAVERLEKLESAKEQWSHEVAGLRTENERLKAALQVATTLTDAGLRELIGKLLPMAVELQCMKDLSSEQLDAIQEAKAIGAT